MQAVAELGYCVRCGRHYPPQVAHRNEGKAKGKKNDDCLTAALCFECHAAIDQGKDMTRAERRAEIDRAIVMTVLALVLSGRLRVHPIGFNAVS